MCRCGGIIRGVLSTQETHDAYVKLLNTDIGSEKKTPNTIINNIAKDGKIRSSDIGSRKLRSSLCS